MEIENGTYQDKGFVKGINGNKIILSRKPGDFKDTFFDERKDYEDKQVGEHITRIKIYNLGI